MLRRVVLAVGAMSMGCVSGASAQSNRYIEMGLGVNAAPPLVAHGSDNDWSTKCDLIINPLGLETGGECDSTPPRTSWTNAFGRGNGFGAGMAGNATTTRNVSRRSWIRCCGPRLGLETQRRPGTYLDVHGSAAAGQGGRHGNARVSGSTLGYQLLAGVDYRLGEQPTLGVKLRWVGFEAFESGETLWSQLRSHESSVGRAEDILYMVTTDDNGYWGLGVSLKYLF